MHLKFGSQVITKEPHTTQSWSRASAGTCTRYGPAFTSRIKTTTPNHWTIFSLCVCAREPVLWCEVVIYRLIYSGWLTFRHIEWDVQIELSRHNPAACLRKSESSQHGIIIVSNIRAACTDRQTSPNFMLDEFRFSALFREWSHSQISSLNYCRATLSMAEILCNKASHVPKAQWYCGVFDAISHLRDWSCDCHSISGCRIICCAGHYFS